MSDAYAQAAAQPEKPGLVRMEYIGDGKGYESIELPRGLPNYRAVNLAGGIKGGLDPFYKFVDVDPAYVEFLESTNKFRVVKRPAAQAPVLPGQVSTVPVAAPMAATDVLREETRALPPPPAPVAPATAVALPKKAEPMHVQVQTDDSPLAMDPEPWDAPAPVTVEEVVSTPLKELPPPPLTAGEQALVDQLKREEAEGVLGDQDTASTPRRGKRK